MSTATETSEEVEVTYPRRWKVVVFNNETASEEFLLAVLVFIFEKDENDAVAVVRTIKNDGKCPTGVYSKEIATNYVAQAQKVCKEQKVTLKMVLEEA